MAIAAVAAFVLGRAAVGSIAWACSCGPTGIAEDGSYKFQGGVSIDKVFVDDLGWPYTLNGFLALSSDETGTFVLRDAASGAPVLTLVVENL